MFHHGSPTEREASSPNIANQKSSPVIYRVSNPLMMTMTPALLYIRVTRVTSSARPLLLPPGSVGCRGSRAQSWMRNFYKGKHMIRDGNLLEAKWRPKFPPPYTRRTWPYPAGSLRQHTSPGDMLTFPCQNPLNASISSLYYTLATVALARDTIASLSTSVNTYCTLRKFPTSRDSPIRLYTLTTQ